MAVRPSDSLRSLGLGRGSVLELVPADEERQLREKIRTYDRLLLETPMGDFAAAHRPIRQARGQVVVELGRFEELGFHARVEPLRSRGGDAMQRSARGRFPPKPAAAADA